MAIKVTTGQQTFIKKIVVGTPISTAQTGLSIDNFSDFSVATKSDGQILVYDSAEGAFKNYELLVDNGLAKAFTPGTDKLLLRIDSDKTPVMTGLQTKGNIVPTLDSTFDLGDSDKKFKDLYLSGGTIHLGGIDIKDSGGTFGAKDSSGNPVNIDLQGSIAQIRQMFASGGDLTYDTGTGIFQFDVEQVYTKENFDSDFNVTLDSAVLEGVGLTYDNATNTLSIDSSELEANFKQDIRGYFSSGGDLSYNASTGQFSFDVEQVYTRANFESDLGEAVDGGVGIAFDSATDTIRIDSSELSSYFRQDIRGYISANDAGGDGGFAYDNTTGIFTYTGPSATEVRAHLAAVDAGGDGSFSYDSSTGAYTYTGPSATEVRAHMAVVDAGGDGSLTYDSSTGAYTYTGPSASEVRSHFSAQGDLSYDSATGVFQFDVEQVYTKANFDSDFNVAMDSGTTNDLAEGSNNLYYTVARSDSDFDKNLDSATTDKLSEGSNNLYYTVARSDSDFDKNLDSASTDNLSEGSTNLYYTVARSDSDFDKNLDSASTDKLSEGSTNLYYTVARADSAAKAALLGGTGVTYDSSTGVIAIGQPVGTTDNVTFNSVRGPANFVIDPAAVGDNTGTVQILGNLQVEGTETVLNSTTVTINDKNIILADSAANAAAADGAGITINGASASLTYAASGDKFVFNKPFEGQYLGFDSDFDSALTTKTTSNLAEGTNLYYTTARTNSDATALITKSFVDALNVDADTLDGQQGAFYMPKSGGTFTGNVSFGDDVRARFGADNDLDIYHDNSGNNVKIVSSLPLTQNYETAFFLTSNNLNQTSIKAQENLGVELYYNGSKKIETTNTGITVTGSIVGEYAGFDSDFDSALGTKTTSNLAEGTNLYYTVARSDSDFDKNLDSASTDKLSEGSTNLYYTSARADSDAKNAITGNKGLTYNNSTGVLDIDSSNVRGMFSAGGDLSYNSGTGEFSFDVEAVYTKENFDSDYFFAKDSANTAVERNKHDATTKNFTVTVATKTADHVYNGSGSGQGYVIDGTQSPIVQLQIGRTYRFTLSSSDMSSHPFRFYYDAAKTTQYTTNVTTTSTYAEIEITESTPPVLHYQCSAHGYMGHALVIGTRNLTGFTTTNLTEGSNLYYTDGRFDTRLAAKTTDDLTEGSSNLYYTDARAQSAAQAVSLDSAEAQAMIDSNINNDITFGGDVTFDSAGAILFDKSDQSLKFGDNKRIRLGASNDLQIYHSGTASNIINTTGNLIIADTSGDVKIQGKYGEQSIVANNDGSVELYYDNTKKVETTAYGATVTGTINADSASFSKTTITNSGTIGTLAANVAANAYLKITDGSNTLGFDGNEITGANSSNQPIPIYLSGSNINFMNGTSGTGYIAQFNASSSTKLYYNASQRFATSDSGVSITGELTADSATIGGIRFPKSDGLNNQVIRTDGAGNLSFVSVAAISGAIDSEAVIDLIDSAYVAARSSGGTDSAATQAMIDSNLANNITFGGDVTFDSAGAILFDKSDQSLKFGDHFRAKFGDGSDASIRWNANNLVLQTNTAGISLQPDTEANVWNGSAYIFRASKTNNKVELYANNTKRLETTDSGVNVTGNIRVDNAPFTSGITVQEEGSSLSTAGTTLNFVGDNVTATGSGATKTITITGGSGATGFINNVKANTFTGDASTTAFTLSNAPADSDDVLVFINGVLQHTNTYSISGTTLTLDSAPDSASEIETRTHLLQSANLVLRDHKSYVYTLDTTTDSVSGADSAGVTLAYDVGKVDVFANGSRLVTGKDFTATNGTSIVFDSAFSSGNVIEVVSHAKATTADLNGILSIDSDLTTTGANQIIYTYAAANHRTLKFTAQIEHDSSSSYHAEEVLLTHNDSNVAMTTYAQVLLDSNLGTFDADINSGNVRIKFSPTKTNTSIKLRAIRTPA